MIVEKSCCSEDNHERCDDCRVERGDQAEGKQKEKVYARLNEWMKID